MLEFTLIYEPGLIGRLARKLHDSHAAAVHTHLIHAPICTARWQQGVLDPAGVLDES